MSLNGHLGNSEIGGCKEIRQPFANPSPTPRQPFANPSPTFRQPFANLFWQPLSNPLLPWTPGTRLETRVNGFLVSRKLPISMEKLTPIMCFFSPPSSVYIDWRRARRNRPLPQQLQCSRKSSEHQLAVCSTGCSVLRLVLQ